MRCTGERNITDSSDPVAGLEPLTLQELARLSPGEKFVVATYSGHGRLIDGPVTLYIAEVVIIMGGTIIRTREGCYWLIRNEDRRDANVIPTFNGRSCFFRNERAPAERSNPRDDSPLSTRRRPWCIELDVGRSVRPYDVAAYISWIMVEALDFAPVTHHDRARNIVLIYPDGMSEMKVAWVDSFVSRLSSKENAND